MSKKDGGDRPQKGDSALESGKEERWFAHSVTDATNPEVAEGESDEESRHTCGDRVDIHPDYQGQLFDPQCLIDQGRHP